MGMTITEKILAAHAGKDTVSAGEIISAKVDIALGNDITAPIAIKEFEKLGVDKVFDPTRIALVPDHFCPNKDIKSAEQAKILRNFSAKHGITHYYDVGEMGVEHSLLPEQGVVTSGDLVIGADSHTCTYGALGAFSTGVGSTDLAAAIATGEVWLRVPEAIKFVYKGSLPKHVTAKDLILYTIGDIGVDGALYKSMEFTGEAIEQLPISGRLTMANMAIEAGGKNGIIAPDAITKKFVEPRSERSARYYASDDDASYCMVKEYNVSEMEPQVAFPHLPENTRPISQAGDVKINQVIIGSCTNGLLDDLRLAAEILKGHKVAKGVRLIVIPATPTIYRQAMHEGLFDIFLDAGAAISTPTCGPCLGGHMGILAAGERAVATTNRNFVGRMGHPKSEVYLSGVPVAAASAVTGKISGPSEL